MNMQFTVVIFDTIKKEFVTDGRDVDEAGLMELLKIHAGLNKRGRRSFVYRLINYGEATHNPNFEGSMYQYRIGAIKHRN